MGRLHTFAAGDDLSSFDASFWSGLLTRALGRPSTVNVADWTFWPGSGGLYRLGVVSGLEVGETVVLDAEADWRDRIHTTACLRSQPGEWGIDPGGPSVGPAFPGAPNDKLTRPAFALSAISSGYTGNGLSLAAGSTTTAHGWKSQPGDVYRMYARNSDGALMLYRDSTDTDPYPDTAYVLVMATEQLGERSAPGTHPSLAVVDATQVEPHILNGFQDRALLGQMRDGETVASDCFPMGPKLDGGGIPELWTIRGARVRQPVAGMIRKVFALGVADESEVDVNTEIDWRDRLVWVSGRRSTSQIYAGGVAEASHNAAEGFNSARYTGPGEDGPLTLQGYSLKLDDGSGSFDAPDLMLRVRPSDGALMIANETGSTQFVTLMVGASFQLGPHSS